MTLAPLPEKRPKTEQRIRWILERLKMAENNQNPGHKWRKVENDGDGDRYFDSYRFSPFTTDLEFFRDLKIHETEVTRATQQGDLENDSYPGAGPRGVHRTDEMIKDEIDELLTGHG